MNNKTRILVVGGDAAAAASLGRRLAALGYEPVLADDLAAFQQTDFPPHLALVGSGVNGAKPARRLRERHDSSDRAETARALRERYDIPVVYISDPQDQAAHDVLEAGPHSVLRPSADDHELRLVVEFALYQEAAERRLQQARANVSQNDALVRALVANARDVILIMDAGRILRHVSPSVETLLGYRPEEVIGRDAFEFMHPDDRQATLAALTVALQDPTAARRVEHRLRHKDGSWRIAESLGRLLPPDIGRANVVVNVRDITERRQAEARLRQLSRAVEQSPASIVITDTAGRIEYVNPRFTQVTGYTLEEVVGENPRLLKSGETAPEVYRQLWQTITAGGEWRGEFHNRKKSGELFWESATLSPIVDSSGRITNFLAVKEDITERKRTDEALRESEARYRLLFENNPHPMWVYDLETLAFLAVNDAAVRHYGFTRLEFLAMTIADIRPVEDVPALLDNVARVTGGLDLAGVWRHCKKDGSVIEVEITSHTLEFAGRPAEVVLAHDVTERRRAEAALRESERRFRETLQNVRLIAVELDVRGRVVFCNDFLLQLAGWQEAEVLGGSWFDRFTPGNLPVRLLFLDAIRSGQIEHHHENEILTRSGERRLISWNNIVLRDQDGRVTGTASLGEDITERRRAEAALAEANARLEAAVGRALKLAAAAEEATRLKSEFLAMISHELRTPLAATLGALDLVLDGVVEGPAEERELLLMADQASRRLLGIVNDLLDITMIEAGRAEVFLQPVEVFPALEEVVALHRQAAAEKGLSLRLQPPADLNAPLVVRADAGRLRQILVHLVANAIKFTERGQVVLDAVREADGRRACLTVQDTGAGIAPERQSRLFQLFVQADGSMSRRYGGTGLGLTISRRLAEMMDGTLILHSAGEGQGSTFSLSLPLAGAA